MGTLSCTPLVLYISKVRAKYRPHQIIFGGPKRIPYPLLPTRAQERKCARVSVWTCRLRCDGHDILHSSGISKVRAKYRPHRIIFGGPKRIPYPLLPTRAQERKLGGVNHKKKCVSRVINRGISFIYETYKNLFT